MTSRSNYVTMTNGSTVELYEAGVGPPILTQRVFPEQVEALQEHLGGEIETIALDDPDNIVWRRPEVEGRRPDETVVIFVDVDPITLSTEVVGAVMDTWAPQPVTVFVQEGTHQAHLDAIRKIIDHYDPTFVIYKNVDNVPANRVFIGLTGVPIRLDPLPSQDHRTGSRSRP